MSNTVSLPGQYRLSGKIMIGEVIIQMTLIPVQVFS